ncbi:hypothetical protein niasHS_011933 [Heterodera schachtii]|uniref:Uncharacterized protein n=1 Tax=Heterodera schachtii TaxID=97005 RepID=A0ABD2J4U2_HETSC
MMCFVRIVLSPIVLSGFNVPMLLRTVVTQFQSYSLVSMRLHMVAMAANRAHAVLFPFHYAQKVTKKTVFIQCMLIHLMAIISVPFYSGK